jgi:hypothetical protein
MSDAKLLKNDVITKYIGIIFPLPKLQQGVLVRFLQIG